MQEARLVEVGDVLESPVFDLRAVVLETSRDLLRADVRVGARGNGGPLHRHLRQEERFLVRDGTLRVRDGFRESRVVYPGEEVAIPPGSALHRRISPGLADRGGVSRRLRGCG
jgi:mannose-6-phosphate isomerase-like protein (cupin superfamily)